jgi:CubicO group peptidase (beta-lactamase class C family)
VFGAVLARKLAPRGITPHAYLRERILDPIGVTIGAWRSLKDGTQPLPTGAYVGAREWATFGDFVANGGVRRGKRVVDADALARCFVGSAANARYGLCWWLSPLPSVPDLVYASGAGGQALYIVPSRRLVIVKFGNAASYKHDAFLRRFFN